MTQDASFFLDNGILNHLRIADTNNNNNNNMGEDFHRRSSVWIRLIILLRVLPQSYAFLPVPPRTTTTTQTTTTVLSNRPLPVSTTTALNCICIDCKWVTKCAAYHFVETKHEQPHMSENPTFEPREGSPTIHVNIRTIRTEEDREKEIQRMWKEHKAEEEKAAAATTSESDDTELHGDQVYDFAPMTTYEYDVVACEDFVEDKGCWIRNMPDEIRKANPDFVPS